MARLPVQIGPGDSGGYAVAIGGTDLSRYIEAVSFSIDVNDGLTPQLSLRMTRAINVTAEADAKIAIPDELATLLIGLGWTPPAAETATTEGK